MKKPQFVVAKVKSEVLDLIFCFFTFCSETVQDSDGNVSEGYPITIGQSYGQTEDVNQDGNVNISDVYLVVNVILGNATNNRADVNGDGDTNVSDVYEVVNEIVG